MIRIIVFGIGKIYRQYIDRLGDNSEVVAIVDNSISIERVMDDGRVVSPVKCIRNLEYDFIVIFNKKYIREIVEQLVSEYSVPRRMIIGWQEYLGFKGTYYKCFMDNYMGYNFLKIVNELPKVIDRLECLNVCDYGLVLAKVGVRGKSSFARGIKGFQLTGVNTEHINIFQGHNNLYDSIYDMEKFWQGRYDMVLLMDMYYKAGIDKVYELVRDALKISKYVMLCVPFPAVDGQGWSAECFSALGIVKEFFVEEQKYFIIGAGKVVKESEVNIYVVTHKKFIPIYGDFDRIRIPIQAGAALNPSFGYERDDNGDNISTLNPYINECTAIYWVWKNVRCRYVGFEHYRRVFLSNPYSHDPDYILGENDIKRYLCDEKYDFIVASNANNYPITTYENLRDDILPEAFIRYKVLFEERINEVAPEYMDVYMECFNGFSFYPANMFITSWERFDEYCKWFFGIVLSMVDVENLDSYDTYNKRVVGFFAERLLTVWIMKRGYRVMEMPYMCKEIRIENFNENDKN